MSVNANLLGPGDVIVTREGSKGWLIRVGDWLKNPGRKTHRVNHVIVFHHVDEQGRKQGVEGRPGGVGWRELTDKLLSHPDTRANTEQVKSEADRYLVAVAVEKIIGTPYDWQGIAADSRQALHLWRTFRSSDWQDGATPGQMVCSSMADWAYEQVGLPNPGGMRGTRFTTPGDWLHWIKGKLWERNAAPKGTTDPA